MTIAKKLAWGFLYIEVALVLAAGAWANWRNAAPKASAAITADGRRWGLTDPERRRAFSDLVAGEPSDRIEAQKISETAVWNRNHDDFFHQRELGRVAAIAGHLHLPMWTAFLILDEGMRNHWPPPPGVELRLDDAPLARTTAPIERHPLLVKGPPLAPPVLGPVFGPLPRR